MLVDFCTGRRGHHFRRDEGLAVRRALGAVPLHVLGPRRLVPLLVLTRRGLCGNQNLRRVRVVLHAIDATPARRRGGVNSSPLDRARTAASSPPDALVDFHTGRGDALRGHGLVLPSGGRVHLFAGAVHPLRRALRHPGLLPPRPHVPVRQPLGTRGLPHGAGARRGTHGLPQPRRAVWESTTRG